MTSPNFLRSEKGPVTCAKGSTRLLAGWLIDGSGGEILRNALIFIRDGRFVDIASADSRPPSDVFEGQTIDLPGCSVIPGLIDCHVHLALSGKAEAEARKGRVKLAPEEAFSVIAGNLSAYPSHGVLAIRDGGDAAGHTLRYKTGVLGDGESPIILKSPGAAIHAAGRYGKLLGRPVPNGLTLPEYVSFIESDADHIKVINSGINSLTEFGRLTPPQFSAEDLELAFALARRRGLKSMVHANGEVPVEASIEAGCDSVEHGFFMGRRNLERMAERGVFWAPTACTMKALSKRLPQGSVEAEVSKRNLDSQLRQISEARRIGVPIVVGTDSGGFGVDHGVSHVEEMRLLLDAGCSIQELVRCASLNGALLLGVEDLLGRIAPGMPATFVALRGGPDDFPDSLRSPEMIYIDGSRAPAGFRFPSVLKSPEK